MLCGPYDLQDLARRMMNWEQNAYWTAHNEVFDMGIATSGAISRLAHGTTPVMAGGTDEGSNGNGSNANDNVAATTGDARSDSHNSPEMNAEMNEEMYHYAKIVEIKHKELKTIEKDEPLLYRQFSSDVSKLDSVYHGLQHELPKNPNKEQIIEAMIQNLQLQMELLNHQLDIIKQINHSKKTAYDKAYKTA